VVVDLEEDRNVGGVVWATSLLRRRSLGHRALHVGLHSSAILDEVITQCTDTAN